jgi:LPXTG-motif cell wall-anchored protein
MSKNQALLAALALAVTSAVASADTWNKKTKLTFSGPVQVPGPHTQGGVVTLQPGTYVFRLLDSQSDRKIVQVTNLKQDKVFTTILGLNDYRVNASSKTVMYFTERASGAPQAVKAWFYPGDNYGVRFVYPKAQAVKIAATVNQPVPSHTVEVVETTKYVEVPVYIQTPAKQEAKYEATTFNKTDATDTAGVDGEAVKEAAPAPAPAPAKLPKTGSALPLIGMSGLFLAGSSFLLRRLRSR